MAVKVSVISSGENRIAINNQSKTQIKTVSVSPHNRIAINDQDKKQIRTVGLGTINNISYSNTVNIVQYGSNSISNLVDVDASNPDNNETLVYDAASGKYIVRELPVINGGTF